MAPTRGRPRATKTSAASEALESPTTLHANLPMIEVTEPWLLDAVLKDTQANRMIVVRLDERTALVVPGQYENLLARLRKIGHTPRTLER